MATAQAPDSLWIGNRHQVDEQLLVDVPVVVTVLDVHEEDGLEPSSRPGALVAFEDQELVLVDSDEVADRVAGCESATSSSAPRRSGQATDGARCIPVWRSRAVPGSRR